MAKRMCKCYSGVVRPFEISQLYAVNRTDKASKLGMPEDKTITSLFITGIEDNITETDLRYFTFAWHLDPPFCR